MFAIAPLSLLAFAVSSAGADPRLVGSGTLATETRDLAPFRAVSSELSFPVDIAVGAPQAVSITCDDDLLRHIVTTVRDGSLTLEVEDDRDLTAAAGCMAKVTLPALDAVSLAGSGRITVTGEAAVGSVSLAGSGDVEIATLATRRLDVSLAGSGDVVASGTAAMVDVSVAGSGDVRLADLVALEARVSLVGSGDVALNVSKSLDVTVTGSGDVEVRGTPAINQTILGSGRVRTSASM